MKAIVTAATLIFLPASAGSKPANPLFLVKPYVQLGNNPRPFDADTVQLIWRTGELLGSWSIETRKDKSEEWAVGKSPQSRIGHIPTMPGHLVFTANISGLSPGEKTMYRIRKDGKTVFSSSVRCRSKSGQLSRFVVFGDLAAGTKAQKQVAYQIYLKQPDYAVLTGDIVYPFGRFSDYWARFFPVYNAERPDPDRGAPLIRSTTFIAVPGNHDICTTGKQTVTDLNKFPDGLAYYYLFRQPLNGPQSGPGNITPVTGSKILKSIFFKEAGTNFPRMASFSFDWGDAHWTILDSNEYVDWTSPVFTSWLIDDLKSARDKSWRFVAFHHAPFTSTVSHYNHQHMRRLSRYFEENKVDIVFTGHVHNYQRTYPLKFKCRKATTGQIAGPVAGQLRIDKNFNGSNKPDGVIYIITGGGGAPLTGGLVEKLPVFWRSYTNRLVASKHSFTLCDMKGKRLVVRQIACDGKQLDSFTIQK